MPETGFNFGVWVVATILAGLAEAGGIVAHNFLYRTKVTWGDFIKHGGLVFFVVPLVAGSFGEFIIARTYDGHSRETIFLGFLGLVLMTASVVIIVSVFQYLTERQLPQEQQRVEAKHITVSVATVAVLGMAYSSFVTAARIGVINL